MNHSLPIKAAMPAPKRAERATTPAANRAERRHRTRAAILDAAAPLFARRGFEGVALADVAAKAGVSVPLIVYHYGGKLELWKAAAEHLFGRMLAEVAAGLERAQGLSGRAQHVAALVAHIRALAAVPDYARLLLSEGGEPTDRLEWLVETWQRPYSEGLTALVRRAQADRLLPGDADPLHLTFILLGALTLPLARAGEYRLMDGTDATAPEFLDRHVRSCLQLLLGPGGEA